MVVALPLPLQAHAQSDEQMCRNGLFPRENVTFSLAKVTGNDKLHFLDDMSGCPAKGGKACEQPAYVLPGDTLLVSKHQGSFLCAFYPNKGGGSAGWVPQERLQEMAFSKQPMLRQWAGTWKDGDNMIRIEIHGAALRAWGDAYWPSKRPSAQFPGGPHLGGMAGIATPERNTVTFEDRSGGYSVDACRVNASLVNDLLVVSDNQNCGGENVSFSGVYLRKH